MAYQSTPYNIYEAFINAMVGAGVYAFNHGTRNTRGLLEYSAEKAIINFIASWISYYVNIGSMDTENMDVEYITSAILAGLYHNGRSMSAAGEQFAVSVFSHILTTKSSKTGVNFINTNFYGTTATVPTGN